MRKTCHTPYQKRPGKQKKYIEIATARPTYGRGGNAKARNKSSYGRQVKAAKASRTCRSTIAADRLTRALRRAKARRSASTARVHRVSVLVTLAGQYARAARGETRCAARRDARSRARPRRPTATAAATTTTATVDGETDGRRRRRRWRWRRQRRRRTPRRDDFFPPHLLVVAECFVEQGKSVVDVLGDSYRIVLRCLRLAQHLDPFPGGRLRRLPGKLGPSHVHLFSTADLNLAAKFRFHFTRDLCPRPRGAPTLSRTLYTDVRSPIYARAHTHGKYAHEHGHRGRRVGLSGRCLFGPRRPASAALGCGRKIRAYLSNREPGLLRRATPLKAAPSRPSPIFSLYQIHPPARPRDVFPPPKFTETRTAESGSKFNTRFDRRNDLRVCSCQWKRGSRRKEYFSSATATSGAVFSENKITYHFSIDTCAIENPLARRYIAC